MIQEIDAQKQNRLYAKKGDNLSQNASCDTAESVFNSQNESDKLASKLEEINQKQGAISNVWNSFKNFTGIGSSSNKCEKAIEDYNNGKISFEKASEILDKYDCKQENSLNLFSNILTGATVSLVLGSAVATGGLSIGIIAAAAGIGGAIKAGFKLFDRATNQKENDALDAKLIAKDTLTGALDGAVSIGTMGMNITAVNYSEAANKTIASVMAQGVKEGAKSGAISGGITGAGDYAINCAFDENQDFEFGEFVENTALTAAGGAVFGGVTGAATRGIQYRAKTNTLFKRQEQFKTLDKQSIAKMSDIADELSTSYTHNNEVLADTDNVFENLSDVEKITARAKSSQSTFAKLANARTDGKLDDITFDNCLNTIKDAYGSRIQIRNLTVEESKSVVENFIAESNNNYSYSDFCNFVNENYDNLTPEAMSYFELNNREIFDALKEKQTDQVVEQLSNAIANKQIKIKNLKNYGDFDTTYFTQAQIERIADVYDATYHEPLEVVAKIDLKAIDNLTGVTYDREGNIIAAETDKIIYITKGAMKDSGYVSSQMNIEYLFEDNTTGLGELQIRGIEVNPFADTEHIPYDINSNKITQYDKEYKKVFDIVKNMKDGEYSKYNQYLTKVYKSCRLRELGIESVEPQLDESFGKDALTYLTKDGLIAFKNSLPKFSIFKLLKYN